MTLIDTKSAPKNKNKYIEVLMCNSMYVCGIPSAMSKDHFDTAEPWYQWTETSDFGLWKQLTCTECKQTTQLCALPNLPLFNKLIYFVPTFVNTSEKYSQNRNSRGHRRVKNFTIPTNSRQFIFFMVANLTPQKWIIN